MTLTLELDRDMIKIESGPLFI